MCSIWSSGMFWYSIEPCRNLSWLQKIHLSISMDDGKNQESLSLNFTKDQSFRLVCLNYETFKLYCGVSFIFLSYGYIYFLHLRLPRRIIRVWISNKMFIWAVNHQILRYQHAEIDPNFPPSCGGGQIIQIRQGRTIPRILGIYSTIKST